MAKAASSGAVAADPDVDTGRSARKRRAILEAAREVFLRGGYERASMDEVAAKAKVSKQTVYKHFADKERLFSEIVTSDIRLAESRSQEAVDALPDSEDVAADLRQFARQHIAIVMQPHLIRLRRIIIGGAERFPDLARTWYDTGPGRAHTTLAARFRALAERGRLRVADPLLAAEHFNWLVLSIPMNKAMFYGSEIEFAPEELDRYADEGVRVFLAAYGAD